MKKLFYSLLLITPTMFAQVGIGTTNPNALLEIESTNQASPSNTDGILIPRIDEFPSSDPGANQDGMLVYATGSGSVAKGFYYWDNGSTSWVLATGAKNIDDLSDGLTDGTGSSVFLGIGSGTNDDGTNNQNTSMGYQSLLNNDSGPANTALGYWALRDNTSGNGNTAVGHHAARANNTGTANTMIGAGSLYQKTTGNNNVAIGGLAGGSLTSGEGNIFIGYRSAFTQTSTSNKLYIENSDAVSPLIYGEFDNDILRANGTFQIGNPLSGGYALPTVAGSANQVLRSDGSGGTSWVNASVIAPEKIDDLTDGKSDDDGTNNGSSIFLGVNAGNSDDVTDNQNIGIGLSSMFSNSSGYNNTAIGYITLRDNTTGYQNTAVGHSALQSNTTGYSNTAVGSLALQANQGGISNAAFGRRAMEFLTSGLNNTAIGTLALQNNTAGDRNTAVGSGAGLDVQGDENVIIGALASRNNTTGSRNTVIGNYAGFDIEGDENVILGVGNAIAGTRTISNSVIIGSYAGQSESNSNRLYIENSNSTSPLIYGEFDNDVLGFNADVGINTQSPSASLHVNHQSGSATEGFVLSNATDADEWRMYVQWNSNTLAMFFNNTNVGNFDDVSGTYTAVSDRRMKSNVSPIDPVLDRVQLLEVVDYNFVHQSDSRKYTGLIAQDVQKIFPNLVTEPVDATENFTMDYAGFGVLAIKAIQEQQKEIDLLKEEISELKELIKASQNQ